MPAGVLIFFAVSLVVAVGAFALIRRWLIAIPATRPEAVGTLFDCGHDPTMATVGQRASSLTLLVGIRRQ
jgi:hypothetical protein